MPAIRLQNGNGLFSMLRFMDKRERENVQAIAGAGG